MEWAAAIFLSGQRYGLGAAWDGPIRVAGITFQEAVPVLVVVVVVLVASAEGVSAVAVPGEVGN